MSAWQSPVNPLTNCTPRRWRPVTAPAPSGEPGHGQTAQGNRRPLVDGPEPGHLGGYVDRHECYPGDDVQDAYEADERPVAGHVDRQPDQHRPMDRIQGRQGPGQVLDNGAGW